MKIKIPAKRETATQIVSVRFTPSELKDVRAAANDAKMEIAPFIRVIVANAVRLGVEVSD